MENNSGNNNNRENINNEVDNNVENDAPAAGFGSNSLMNAFAEFNNLTGGNTKFANPEEVIEEFKQSFIAQQELEKTSNVPAQTSFQQYLDNYYLSGLSTSIADVYNSNMEGDKPKLTEIALGYNRMMEQVFNSLKEEQYIKTDLSEYTFANQDPQKLVDNMQKTLDSINVKSPEDERKLFDQYNEYVRLVDTYDKEYFVNLPSLSEIQNAKKDNVELNNVEPRPSGAPAPTGFESERFSNAIDEFNNLVGENSVFSDKNALINEIKDNYKKYKDMISEEDEFGEPEARAAFKMDYLDRVYAVKLKQIAEEQAKKPESDRLSPLDLAEAYGKVEKELYGALLEENIIDEVDANKAYGGMDKKDIAKAIKEGYTAGGLDVNTPEMTEGLNAVESKLGENNYPELPEEAPVDSKESKANKAEYNFEKDFENELKAFEQFTHIHIEVKDVKEEFDRMKKIPADAKIDNPDLQGKVLENAYSNFYKTNLSNAMYTNAVNVNNGTSFASPQNVANAFDRLMIAIDQEAKKAGIISDKYVRDTPETVSAETKYAEALRFCQNPKDRKEAKQAYDKAKTLQSKNVDESLHKEILKMNKELGTNFSSKGIIDHLAHKFKDVPSGDVADMKADFPAKYKEFMQLAYTNMLGKIDLNDEKTLSEKSQEFDVFTQKLENIMKQKGWLDMDHRHEFNGGLNPDFVQKAQLDELDKRPQTTQQEAEAKTINATSKYSEMTNLRNDVLNLADKVPEIDKNGMNSIEANTTVNYLRAIDKQNSSRGFFGRFFHPINNYREKHIIKDVTEKLEAKGFKKQDLENLIKNPLSPEQDPIAQRRQKEKDAINAQHASQTDANSKEQEVDKFLQEVPGMDFKKKIDVPECDNRKEIATIEKPVESKIEVNKEKEKVNDGMSMKK